jgi:transcriptional regulator with XRE-family HTH domain
MRVQKDTEELRAVGRRMEEAALAANMNAYDVAEAMQVTHASVYNWFNGTQQPRHDKLEQFARLVKRPVAWLHGAADTHRNLDQELADRLLGIIERVREGEDLGEAYELEMGQKGNLPPHIKRLWSLQTDMIRPRIADVDWGRLPERERKEAARLIANWSRLSADEQDKAARKIAAWVEHQAVKNGH